MGTSWKVRWGVCKTKIGKVLIDWPMWPIGKDSKGFWWWWDVEGGHEKTITKPRAWLFSRTKAFLRHPLVCTIVGCLLTAYLAYRLWLIAKG